MGRLYKRVYRKEFLWSAWRQIQENGRSSRSAQTRREVHEFSLSVERHLDRIADELRSGEFYFRPQQGILAQRPGGKKPRPIVKSPIGNRIVQRSILNVLQGIPKIQRLYINPTSFGGIAGKSVRGAIEVAYQRMAEGQIWYVRSDIAEFFTQVPREVVLERLKKHLPDDAFSDLLDQAVKTELENLSELGTGASAFPIQELGVAQGCCLSPLFANLLLAEFDQELNGRGVTCIRFIDDFLILGKERRSVAAAFKRAQQILGAFGLRAYDPFSGEPKAELGQFHDGLDFLGCRIVPGQIRPGDKTTRNLEDTIRTLFEESERLFGEPKRAMEQRKTYLDTMTTVSNVLQGWGNQYSYCNHPQFFDAINAKIVKREREYCVKFERACARLSADDAQRLLGVHLLRDSKSQPIIQPKALVPKAGENTTNVKIREAVTSA